MHCDTFKDDFSLILSIECAECFYSFYRNIILANPQACYYHNGGLMHHLCIEQLLLSDCSDYNIALNCIGHIIIA